MATIAVLFSAFGFGLYAWVLASRSADVAHRRASRIEDLHLSGKGWRLANGEYETWGGR